MPSYTRGKLRDVGTFVKMSATQEIYTFFNTKDIGSLPDISEGELENELGHLIIAPTNALVIVRASSPKPPRVRKILKARPAAGEQGSVSTFCAVNKLNAALAAGWDLQKRKISTLISNNSRTVTAMAELSNGLYYALAMNAADFTDHGQDLGLLTGLDVNTPAEREKVVRGSSRPKPGYAKKDLGNGDITKPFSSDTDVAANGWEVLFDEQL